MASVSATAGSEICTICLDPLTPQTNSRHLECVHSFHRDCIVTWLTEKKECPVCRHRVTDAVFAQVLREDPPLAELPQAARGVTLLPVVAPTEDLISFDEETRSDRHYQSGARASSTLIDLFSSNVPAAWQDSPLIPVPRSTRDDLWGELEALFLGGNGASNVAPTQQSVVALSATVFWGPFQFPRTEGHL